MCMAAVAEWHRSNTCALDMQKTLHGATDEAFQQGIGKLLDSAKAVARNAIVGLRDSAQGGGIKQFK